MTEVIEEIINVFKGYQYEISRDGFISSPFWEDIRSELEIILEKNEGSITIASVNIGTNLLNI